MGPRVWWLVLKCNKPDVVVVGLYAILIMYN